jgi:hypothetical protein
MTRRGRILRRVLPLLFVLGLLGVAAACIALPPLPIKAHALPIDIASTAVPLKLDDPSARRIGKLIWRGGLSLKTNSKYFGGWSDLYVTPDGQHLTSIADVGEWLTATLDYDKDHNLTGVHGGTLGALHGLNGETFARKSDADSEGMAHMPDGSWLVSFEQEHRIWHYPTLDGVPTKIDDPPHIRRQPANGGIETLTALDDGTIVAISEQYGERPNTRLGWIGTPEAGGHYGWSTFDYAAIPHFDPTSIVRLPDGSFALLERAWDILRGVRIRVMRFDAEQLRPGNTIHAEELAFLATPYAVDNLEGIAAARGPRGETLLWLISDDNFNPLQRTLLLMFELAK